MIFYVMAALSLFVDETISSASFQLPRNLHALSDKSFGAVAFTFFVASAVQHAAHRILAESKPLSGKYGIPRGGAFKFVCCPHYTSEIIIYSCFVALCPGPLTARMLLFVIGNLSVTAKQTKEWYEEKFPDNIPYGSWAALVPGLF